MQLGVVFVFIFREHLALTAALKRDENGSCVVVDALFGHNAIEKGKLGAIIKHFETQYAHCELSGFRSDSTKKGTSTLLDPPVPTHLPK